MGWRVPTALIALTLALPSMAGATPVSSSERKKLAKTFRAYVREPDAASREKLWKGISKLADQLTIAEIEAVIAASTPGEEWAGGYTDELEFTSAGEKWTYSAHLPRKRPKPAKKRGTTRNATGRNATGLIPLVLDIGHGSWKDNSAKERESGMKTWLRTAKCADDVVYIRTRVLDATSLDGRYTSWAGAPRKKAGEPNSDTFAAVLMDAVRDACLRFPIDPDRVYVQGISQTGYWTWWLAQYAPDRWAAVAPVGAVTFHVRKLLVNVVNVPVFVLHGTADPICAFAQAKGAVDDLQKLGGDVDFRPTEGAGHMDGVFVRFGEIWPEVMQRTRNPYPTKFERKFVSGVRPDAFWLRALGIAEGEFNPWAAPCRVAGEIDGQTLRVEASGCDEIAVLISSAMVDVTKPVTIELNGKKAWKKRLRPNARAALDVARERGDGRAFGAVVTLKVK